jgi:hypothetical protein
MLKSRQNWVAGLAFVGLMLATSVALAQPGQGGRGRGQGGRMASGGFMGGGSMGKFMLLMREDVRKHLDLLDEQAEDLQAAAQKAFQSMRNPDEREGAMSGLEKTLNEVLLPHQVKRLDQIATQQAMRGGRGLLSDEMVASLKISDAQRSQIEQRQQEIRDELSKKMAELRQQYEGKILEELTAAQRAKLREMTGEPFEFSQEQRGGGFGGFGGFGGRRPGGDGAAPGPGGARRGGDRGGRRGG